MILNDGTISDMLAAGILVVPECEQDIENCIQPASYDVRLGNNFKFPKAGTVIDVGNPEDFEYEDATTDSVTIHPHSFILATTKEKIVLPRTITAFVEGRSSIGRLGLFIQNAGWIDPGFEGHITLELYNASPMSLTIHAGMRIAQIVFCMMNQGAQLPYNGKYQHQVEATESQIYKDFDKERWGKS